MNHRILSHLKTTGRITLAQAAKLDVFYLSKEISRIRACYGANSIVTSHRMVWDRKRRRYKRTLQYCLTTIGRANIWPNENGVPVKKQWKEWITAYR